MQGYVIKKVRSLESNNGILKTYSNGGKEESKGFLIYANSKLKTKT